MANHVLALVRFELRLTRRSRGRGFLQCLLAKVFESLRGQDEYPLNLRQFDLNLLVALDALLKERNVTRAAERLYLSQPAMSGILGRLRQAFGDELLATGAPDRGAECDGARRSRPPGTRPR